MFSFPAHSCFTLVRVAMLIARVAMLIVRVTNANKLSLHPSQPTAMSHANQADPISPKPNNTDCQCNSSTFIAQISKHETGPPTRTIPPTFSLPPSPSLLTCLLPSPPLQSSKSFLRAARMSRISKRKYKPTDLYTVPGNVELAVPTTAHIDELSTDGRRIKRDKRICFVSSVTPLPQLEGNSSHTPTYRINEDDNVVQEDEPVHHTQLEGIDTTRRFTSQVSLTLLSVTCTV